MSRLRANIPEQAKGRVNAKKQVRVKGKTPLQRYSNVYINKKSVLFPLMEQAMGEPIPKDANHGEMVALYIDLLKTDPEFAAKIREMVGAGDEDMENAVDPITGISDAISGIFGYLGERQEGQNIESQQEAMMYQSILEGQKDKDTKTILLVSGLSLVAVVGIIIVISKSKK